MSDSRIGLCWRQCFDMRILAMETFFEALQVVTQLAINEGRRCLRVGTVILSDPASLRQHNDLDASRALNLGFSHSTQTLHLHYY
jgi:hypothetical protein